MRRRRLALGVLALTLVAVGITAAPAAAVETTDGKARVGTNPRTGETIVIPAKKTPFKITNFTVGTGTAIEHSPAVEPAD